MTPVCASLLLQYQRRQSPMTYAKALCRLFGRHHFAASKAAWSAKCLNFFEVHE